MPQKEFEFPLDGAGREWMRVRFRTVDGGVHEFTVQYETTVNGKRVPVVRYDNAHGFCHRDVLDRFGSSEKYPVVGSPGEVLTNGKRDIQENWARYREDFFGGAA